MQDIGAKKAAAHIAKAKAHEAYVSYKADRRVAKAMQHAIKHTGGHAEETAALAQGGMLPAAVLSGLETAKVSGEGAGMCDTRSAAPCERNFTNIRIP